MTDTNTQNTTQHANTPPEESGPAGKMFTQDEVNALIRDRLARERAKYADYSTLRDALKSKADQLEAVTASSADELSAANARAADLQKQLDDLNRANMLARVSAATGVPVDLIHGETEDECTAQAEKIAAFARPAYPHVKDGGEPYHVPSAPNVAAAAFERDRKHKPKEFNPYQ